MNKSAPYGASNAQDSLDMAFALSNFGQQVSLFFVDDGVFQLVNTLAPAKIQHKAFHKSFAALEFYDIENVYVCQQSLAVRNLSAKQLGIEVKVFEAHEFSQLIEQSAQVMVF